ncbi:MAG TPA: VC0807 family protein [Steroidobacteraceae bacterium]|nr:VC0807 family protein [Steroidobacteraceae bacterium]
MTTTADRIADALTWARTRGREAGLEIAVNFALPFVVYSATRNRLGDLNALMAASAPPLVWSLLEFLRRRRIDALSLLVLAGIVLSLLAFIGGGGVRFLQLREQLVSAVIGLLFLGSAAIGKPLIYQLTRAHMQRDATEQAGGFETLSNDPGFRRVMMRMTLSWGIALVGQSAACGALVFALSIKTYLIVGPIIGYSVLGAMTAWSFWYARRRITPLREEAERGTH